jgi:RNA polymerase sigma-70 factor (ECF subfamily)
MDDRRTGACDAAEVFAEKRTAAGETAADVVRAVWHEHRRWVAAVLLAYKPAHAELDDLLQDVAMALVKNIAELRDQRNARAWLRTVAINAARAAARPGRNRPMLRLASDDDHVGAGAVCDPLASGDEARRLLEFACELPGEYSEPLLLRSIHGMSAREVAAILDISEVAVHNRVSRARRMLRERVERSAPAASGPAAVRRSQALHEPEARHSTLRYCDGGAA